VRAGTWYTKTALSRRRMAWYSTSHSGHRRKREMSTYTSGMGWDGVRWGWIETRVWTQRRVPAWMLGCGRQAGAHTRRGYLACGGCEGSGV
jgi:hypothetical protein